MMPYLSKHSADPTSIQSKRVDLRKMFSDQNLAVLFHHTSSEAQFWYLVSLKGCRFLDGHASFVPLLRRKDQSDKMRPAIPNKDFCEEELNTFYVNA